MACLFDKPVRPRTGFLIGLEQVAMSIKSLHANSPSGRVAMADIQQFECALSEALSELSAFGFSPSLRKEQRECIFKLVYGGDVLAVLPTGFGKSLIFQLLVRLKEVLTKKAACVAVVCPLKSIEQDQIVEALAMGLTAGSLAESSVEDIQDGKYQLLFGSAEDVLNDKFLSSLKNNSTKLHQNLAAVVIDESHTVETWTGKRLTSRKGKTTLGFRESFGKLAALRSFCKEGTPMCALTGTADQATQATIKKSLCLKYDVFTVYVSPNRPNLYFYVKKVKKQNLHDQLKWLVEIIKEKGKDTPKTIVFCNTMNEIASVINYLICKLGSAAYYQQDSKNPENCLLGMYHSHSWQSNKDRIIASFKGNGLKRVVIATTALCMGVNFADVRYIINWGPARTILDQHQEAGRAGRDGLPAHIIVIYYGQQIGLCELEVKEFVRSEGCLRVAAYQSLDPAIKPVLPLHNCCSFCTPMCKCAGNTCEAPVLPFNRVNEEVAADAYSKRQVTVEDRSDLKEALYEVLKDMGEGITLDESSSHGFSEQLIEDIVKNCDTIFNIEDITSNFPVFSVANALRILEVIQELFLDIPNFEETQLFFSSESGTILHSHPINFEENLLFSDESDSDELLEF